MLILLKAQNKISVDYLNEFSDAFIEVEEIYKRKHLEILSQKNLHTDQKYEFEDRYKEAKAIERANEYGIMEGSYLTVRVIEARNLKPMNENNSSDPYAVISIEGQKEETKFVESTLNPKWDESFKFDIKTGKDSLEILILDRDLYSADDFEGKLALNLMQFKDQMKVDNWYDLQSTNVSERWQGEIRVEAQWIHSRIKFFEDLLSRLDQMLEQDHKERLKIEQHLKELRAPFSFLDYLDYGHFEIEEVSQAKQAADGNLGAQFNLMEKRLAVGIDEMADGMGIRQPPWYRWLVWLTLVYVFLTLCTWFTIPNFIDLTFSTLTLFMIEPLSLTKHRFRMLLGGVIFSFFFDIVFLSLTASYWWDFELFFHDTERGVRRFSLICAFILMFVKFFQMFIMWKVSIDYNEVTRWKNRNHRNVLEGESDTSEIMYPKKVENSVFHG